MVEQNFLSRREKHQTCFSYQKNRLNTKVLNIGNVCDTRVGSPYVPVGFPYVPRRFPYRSPCSVSVRPCRFSVRSPYVPLRLRTLRLLLCTARHCASFLSLRFPRVTFLCKRVWRMRWHTKEFVTSMFIRRCGEIRAYHHSFFYS